ncbi:hypothetical protein DV713_00080 [Parageobacillus thermoglucosidasius]|uniref:deaminase domain-containing protein n=1 Tax=Parageobacillus thermoglucosidasius TaxID=1426 RepID=UPI000E155C72|nr:deaminase domain-containing protein [Parageobacillus thermoglucosidasius]RDE36628.1 hypothetical protein DV713_00080 [Parageobacillus thermoglucosidasius]
MDKRHYEIAIIFKNTADKIKNILNKHPKFERGNMAFAIFRVNPKGKLQSKHWLAHSRVNTRSDLDLVRKKIPDSDLKKLPNDFAWLIPEKELRSFEYSEPENIKENEKIDGEYFRARCTEKKIIEALAHYLTPYKHHKIEQECELIMFTERTPCETCKELIEKFREEFPFVNVTIYDNNFIARAEYYMKQKNSDK